jgi:hypothetical protein
MDGTLMATPPARAFQAVASLAQAHQARGPIAPAMAWAHHSMI